MSDFPQPSGSPGHDPAGGGYPAPLREDPGQTLGILALVFAFVFSPAGLIMGVVSRKKSREAGFGDNELGKWGFILSLIFVILSALWICFAFFAAFAASA